MRASEWAFDRINEAFDLEAKGRGRRDEHCARDHAQKYGLLAAHHRTSRRTGWSHNVLPMPAFQQFPIEDYVWRVSGETRTRWVVVRNLWREIRLEATEQGF